MNDWQIDIEARAEAAARAEDEELPLTRAENTILGMLLGVGAALMYLGVLFVWKWLRGEL